MMKRIFWIGFLLLSGLLVACDMDCRDDMNRVRARYGTPDESVTYDSHGYHSVTWTYWSRGKQFVFTWGPEVGRCEMSTYHFPPWDPDFHTEEMKKQLLTQKSLIETKVTECDCVTN